jgi:hypothetical protein
MTQAPHQVVHVKPSANIYTVLIIISLLALCVGIGFSAKRLMSPAPEGYGVSAGQMFEPFEQQKQAVDMETGR